MSGVTVLGSMATRALLAELAAGWGGFAAEWVGGVDVVRRVRAGEAADVVVLADTVMRRLEADGHLVPGSLVGIARSGVFVAVREGAAAPDLSGVEGFKAALLAARRVGYSTGASGDHLLALLDRWGMRAAMDGRLERSPPGVPVGRLLAEGTVDLGLQQHSELLGLPGIRIAGPLPGEAALETVFTAGVGAKAGQADAAGALIARLASAEAADAKRRHGLEPA